MSAWFSFYSICLHFSSINVLFLFFNLCYICSVYKLLLAARNKHYYNYRFSLASENITFKPFFFCLCVCDWWWSIVMVLFYYSMYLIEWCMRYFFSADLPSNGKRDRGEDIFNDTIFLYGLWVTAINTLLSGFFFLVLVFALRCFVNLYSFYSSWSWNVSKKYLFSKVR